MHPAAGDAVEGQDADGVGADAKVHRMAEADHGAVAKNQIEPQRRKPEYHDARDER